MSMGPDFSDGNVPQRSFGERLVGAIKLDATVYEEVEHTPDAMGQAAGVVALAVVARSLGMPVWHGRDLAGRRADLEAHIRLPGTAAHAGLRFGTPGALRAGDSSARAARVATLAGGRCARAVRVGDRRASGARCHDRPLGRHLPPRANPGLHPRADGGGHSATRLARRRERWSQGFRDRIRGLLLHLAAARPCMPPGFSGRYSLSATSGLSARRPPCAPIQRAAFLPGEKQR